LLKSTVDHLISNVIPAARDYDDAEKALSSAFSAARCEQGTCKTECETAKRRAAEVAIAIDGLADRAAVVVLVLAEAWFGQHAGSITDNRTVARRFLLRKQ
jgi:hypothetical protein